METEIRKEVRVSGFIPCYAGLSRKRLHAEQYTQSIRSGVFDDRYPWQWEAKHCSQSSGTHCHSKSDSATQPNTAPTSTTTD